MRKYLNAIVSILELKKPYKVVFRFMKKDREAEYIAYHNKKGKVISHDIRINQGMRSRSLKTLIAHEFIHAWQEENGYTDIHGESFQNAAILLSQELAYMGFKLKGCIYNAEYDKP